MLRWTTVDLSGSAFAIPNASFDSLKLNLRCSTSTNTCIQSLGSLGSLSLSLSFTLYPNLYRSLLPSRSPINFQAWLTDPRTVTELHLLFINVLNINVCRFFADSGCNRRDVELWEACFVLYSHLIRELATISFLSSQSNLLLYDDSSMAEVRCNWCTCWMFIFGLFGYS